MSVATASLLPEPAPRRHDEADLQHAVMQYLDRALPPDAVAHHSPGEGKRSKRAQRDLRRSGHKAGWPDVEIIWRGRALFIELKAPGGALDAVQRLMHQRLGYAGAPVVLCRSVPEVEAVVREAGVPLRGSVMA